MLLKGNCFITNVSFKFHFTFETKGFILKRIISSRKEHSPITHAREG